MVSDDNPENRRTYQIGTVSSLTGIDAHTIRAWERRYGAIKPSRSETGRRQYDDDTVERLQLLKGLVDCSESIGKIAHLSDEALRVRLMKLAEHERLLPSESGITAERSEGKPRLALLAPALTMQVGANALVLSDFEVVASEQEPEALLDSIRREACEIVVLELERLDSGAPAMIQACANVRSAPQVVVLYRFASRATLARAARAGATLVRSPIRLDSLRRVLLDQRMIRRARGQSTPARVETPPAEPAEDAAESAPRRFDDDQLARLFEVTTAIECECPNHMSSLVSGLVAFETYSRECESRDEEDAAQHRRMAAGTAEARAIMERLLAELCEHEGIVV